jgi:hypothetical protein
LAPHAKTEPSRRTTKLWLSWRALATITASLTPLTRNAVGREAVDPLPSIATSTKVPLPLPQA